MERRFLSAWQTDESMRRDPKADPATKRLIACINDEELAARVYRDGNELLIRPGGGFPSAEPRPDWLWFMDGACLDWVEHRDLSRDELRDLLLGTLLGALTAADAMPLEPLGADTDAAAARSS
jgi:hypothetical protein